MSGSGLAFSVGGWIRLVIMRYISTLDKHGYLSKQNFLVFFFNLLFKYFKFFSLRRPL